MKVILVQSQFFRLIVMKKNYENHCVLAEMIRYRTTCFMTTRQNRYVMLMC